MPGGTGQGTAISVPKSVRKIRTRHHFAALPQLVMKLHVVTRGLDVSHGLEIEQLEQGREAQRQDVRRVAVPAPLRLMRQKPDRLFSVHKNE